MIKRSIQLRPSGLMAVIFAAVLAGLSMAGPTPVLPLIQKFYHLEGAEASLVRVVISIVSIAIIIGSSLAGYLAERFGLRRVFIASLVGYGIVGTAAGFMPDIYMMIVLRFIFGLAAAACGVLSLSMIMSNFHGPRVNRWTGIYVGVTTFGVVLLIPIFGWLGNPDWRMAFFLHLMAFPVAALAAWGIVETEDAVTPSEEKVAEKFVWPIGLIALAMLTGVCCASGVLFLPFVLAAHIGAGANQISMAVMSMAMATTISSLLYAPVRGALGLRNTQIIGFTILAGGLVLTAMGTTLWHALLGQMFVGLGIGLVATSLYLIANMIAPAGLQPRFTGIAKSVYYSGPLVSQLLLEPLVVRGGPGIALIGLGAIALAGAVAMAVLLEHYLPRVQLAHA